MWKIYKSEEIVKAQVRLADSFKLYYGLMKEKRK